MPNASEISTRTHHRIEMAPNFGAGEVRKADDPAAAARSRSIQSGGRRGRHTLDEFDFAQRSQFAPVLSIHCETFDEDRIDDPMPGLKDVLHQVIRDVARVGGRFFAIGSCGSSIPKVMVRVDDLLFNLEDRFDGLG